MWNNSSKSHSLLMVMQNGTVTLEDRRQLFTKLNIVLPYDPAMALLVFS
jgi:hypothetical protein